MADQLRHDHLLSLQVRRDANQLYRGLESILSGVNRDAYAVLMTLALFFIDVCDLADIGDPSAALEQIQEAYEAGDIQLADDPAKGRFVFPPHFASVQ